MIYVLILITIFYIVWLLFKTENTIVKMILKKIVSFVVQIATMNNSEDKSLIILFLVLLYNVWE